MAPKRSRGASTHGKGQLRKDAPGNRSGQQSIRNGKRPRALPSALAWADINGLDNTGLDSDSDDEAGGDSRSKERKEIEESARAAEAEARETAEDKRLRLARDVLSRLDAEQRELVHDETDDEDTHKPGDYIGERLAHARLETTGQLFRKVAKGLKSEKVQLSPVRRMRGHKLSPTCVAISPDDATAYSGSKDNSIVRWDVETGKRTTLLPQWKKLPGRKIPEVKAHSKEVLSLAASGDGRYLASGGRDRLIHIWDCRTDALVETFRGHQDAVSALAFRANSLALFSASHDRCVKHWDLNEMGYVETMFGHQAEINAIDSWRKERAVTGGRDRTVRLWKVLEDTHLVFRPVGGGSIDCVRMMNEDWYVTGGEDGNLALWFAMKKKPATVISAAHGHGPSGMPRWISALGCLPQSDLVVSGSNDGALRLWEADVEDRSLKQVAIIPVKGFINGLAVASTGKFLLAAAGQEHRLGRWERQHTARNELCVISLFENSPRAEDIDHT